MQPLATPHFFLGPGPCTTTGKFDFCMGKCPVVMTLKCCVHFVHKNNRKVMWPTFFYCLCQRCTANKKEQRQSCMGQCAIHVAYAGDLRCGVQNFIAVLAWIFQKNNGLDYYFNYQTIDLLFLLAWGPILSAYLRCGSNTECTLVHGQYLAGAEQTFQSCPVPPFYLPILSDNLCWFSLTN